MSFINPLAFKILRDIMLAFLPKCKMYSPKVGHRLLCKGPLRYQGEGIAVA